MAVPTFIFLGQSNMDSSASLTLTPTTVTYRWTGETGSLATATAPVDERMEGIYVWQHKMPHGTYTAYSDTVVGGGGTTITLTGITLTGDQYADRWVFVASAGTGYGEHRKITTNTAGPPAVLTITPATTAPSGSTFHVLTDAETVASSTSTTVTKETAAPATPAWGVNAYVGKWVTVFAAGTTLQARKIVSNTTTVLTVDRAWSVNPVAGDFMRIATGGGVNAVTDISSSNGRFHPVSFDFESGYTYSTGYEYPSGVSMPRIGPIMHGRGCNPIHECSWQLRQSYEQNIYCLHLGIPSALISTFNGDIGQTNFSWFDTLTTNDFHPGVTDDLFDVLTTRTITAAGLTNLDIRGIFTMIGESESQDAYKAERAEENMRVLRDKLRERINTLGASQLDGSRIPFVIGGVRATNPNWTYATTVNDGFRSLAADDPYTGFVDTDDLTVVVGNEAHYDGSATGQIQFGQDLFTKWDELRKKEADATRIEADRLTLSQVRTKIKRRYERNDVSNDASNAQILQFVNDALREVYNTLGDNAWFLRRMETITPTSTQPATYNLPRFMKRLLRIESTDNPGNPMTWKHIGMTDQGRVQIILPIGSATSSAVAHFITQPKDLEQDSDPILLPTDYCELVVVLTCKRLAEAAGNQTVAGYWAAEAQRLWKYVKRDCMRYANMRQDQLTVGNAYDSWTNSSWPAGWTWTD